MGALAEPEAAAWGGYYRGGYGGYHGGYGGYGGRYGYGKRSADEEGDVSQSGPNPDAYFYGAYPYAGYGYSHAYAPYTYGAHGAYHTPTVPTTTARGPLMLTPGATATV